MTPLDTLPAEKQERARELFALYVTRGGKLTRAEELELATITMEAAANVPHAVTPELVNAVTQMTLHAVQH